MFPKKMQFLALFSFSVLASVSLLQADGLPATVKYEVGPGDVLTISVVGVGDLDHVSRVSNSGKIHFPHLGVISVDSMTLIEIAKMIEDDLREREIVRDPTVNVEVNQARSRPVYILGEVLMPGQFVINERMFVLDLLTLAGGRNDVASGVGYLYRRRKDQSAGIDAAAESGAKMVESTMDEAIPIYFDKLFEGTEEVGNVELVAGDVLYVPERRQEFFYVVGDVFSPGQQEIPVGERVSATRALGMANGPTKTAKLRKGVLAWKTEDGSFEHRDVDLRAILQGDDEDFTLRPGDILFVPGSAAKSLAMGMLNAVPGFALQN